MLAYEVLAGKPLMAPRSTPEEVAGRLAGLSLCDMAPIDLQLQPVLRSMLSPVVSQRQAISTFVGSPYFQVRASSLHALAQVPMCLPRIAFTQSSGLRALRGQHLRALALFPARVGARACHASPLHAL